MTIKYYELVVSNVYLKTFHGIAFLFCFIFSLIYDKSCWGYSCRWRLSIELPTKGSCVELVVAEGGSQSLLLEMLKVVGVCC